MQLKIAFGKYIQQNEQTICSESCPAVLAIEEREASLRKLTGNSFCLSEAGATLRVQHFGSAFLPCSNGVCWPHRRVALGVPSSQTDGSGESELKSELPALRSTHRDESCEIESQCCLESGYLFQHSCPITGWMWCISALSQYPLKPVDPFMGTKRSPGKGYCSTGPQTIMH